MVTTAHLGTIQQVIRLAHKLTDHMIEEGILPLRGVLSPVIGDNKRKWEDMLGKSSSSNPNQQQYKKPDNNNNGRDSKSQN